MKQLRLPVLIVLPVFLLTFAFAGCDATADRELKRAQEALDQAQDMGADAHAFDDFRKAEEFFEQAMEANDNNKVQDARALAIKAKLKADDAMSKTKDRVSALKEEQSRLGR